ncbi:hypothetical protein SAMN02910292_02696 [Lachnospiraceae bacterium XBB2008]|nr:hypothetical protein SAMN02910292_02696 [Lachnospiraceae bacterium XBB2008]
MVTEEELRSKSFKCTLSDKPSYKVSKEEADRFKQMRAALPRKLHEVLAAWTKETGVQLTNSTLGEMCRTNEKTIREYLNTKRAITRQFLYKLTIGLQLSLDQADELFELCGGILDPDSTFEDFIVYKAIIDKDDIDSFVEEYNKLVVDGSKIKV